LPRDHERGREKSDLLAELTGVMSDGSFPRFVGITYRHR